MRRSGEKKSSSNAAKQFETKAGRGTIKGTPLAGGLTHHPAEDRGMADQGWLQSAHSFSFGDYYNPDQIQFESLRVINDDRVAAGTGFPTHPHNDAEIFSYILDGALEHRDSAGNGSVVKAGGVQYMSAGAGISHSEFNPSTETQVHFLQIWLLPNKKGGAPRYENMLISDMEKDGKLKLFLSKDGRGGAMQISADADIYAATLDGEQSIRTELINGHKAWVQVARGTVTVNGQTLKQGDGLSISDAGRIEFSDGLNAEFIYFDLEPYRAP